MVTIPFAVVGFGWQHPCKCPKWQCQWLTR